MASGAPVIAERPSALALAAALATPVFRIGGEGPAPEPGPVPMFETLTSGSTGTPRRIRRSHASWIASFDVNAARFGIGPGARVAVLGRLVHSLSLYGAVEGMHLGAEVHLLDGLRPDRQRGALAERRVTQLYATPAQLRLLTDHSGPVCPDLRLILVGGSKLDAALRAAAGKLAPAARIVEFYGAAETSFITLADTTTPEGSVGAVYPGVELELRAGQVWVKSPYLFDGYAGDPGGAVLSEGWLSVCEMGRLDAGWLYLSGRAGRMVTVADQNVFPEEIEALLAALPGIRHGAVLARPDARRGMVLLAVAQGDPAQEAAIMAALRAALGPLKAPKALIWRADWPTLASGKTDLSALERETSWPI
ncbi:AMP-binding protein [Tabrizicola sp. BL-A-41-H6]|uniref:AMP-binding protein n=1 Tax=Tabrizicola sp. BL-A-41-H6 TaxID=3421107 RepID=UPI003D6777BB